MRVLAIGMGVIVFVFCGYTRPITLKQAIDSALDNNLGLAIAGDDLAVAVEDLIVDKAAFDVRLSLNTSQQERVAAGTSTDLDGSDRPESTNRNNNLSVSKTFASGTEVTQSTNLNRNSTNSSFQRLNPDYSSVVRVDVRQPLLSGLGKKVNLAAVRSAASRLNQSELQWRDAVINTIAETERLYWNLAYSYLRKDYLLTSMHVAEQLLEAAEKRERMGAGIQLESLQARAALANRRSDVIVVDQEIESASDELRRAIGDLAVEGELLQPAQMELTGTYDGSVSDLYAKVLDWSFDSRVQEEVIKQREFERDAARNRVKPTLDLTMSGRYLGRSNEADLALEGSLEGNGYFWQGGLELTVPWGLRAERAQFRRSEYILNRERTRLEEIRQNMLLEARDAYRSLQTAQARMEVTELTVSLNEEQFEQEKRRHEAGGSAFRDVLEAQEDLDEARMQRLEALRNANQALALIESLDGSLLDRHGFTWEEIVGEN